MGKWIERQPQTGETVRFCWSKWMKKENPQVGVYLRMGMGSAKRFFIIDIGNRKAWMDEDTTLEVWDYINQ